jgi:hypothetical protein
MPARAGSREHRVKENRLDAALCKRPHHEHIAVSLALLGTGCSYMASRPRPPERIAIDGCPSRAAPGLDLYMAISSGALAAAGLAEFDEGGDKASLALSMAALGVGFVALFGASAHYGFQQANRRNHDDHVYDDAHRSLTVRGVPDNRAAVTAVDRRSYGRRDGKGASFEAISPVPECGPDRP